MSTLSNCIEKLKVRYNIYMQMTPLLRDWYQYYFDMIICGRGKEFFPKTVRTKLIVEKEI